MYLLYASKEVLILRLNLVIVIVIHIMIIFSLHCFFKYDYYICNIDVFNAEFCRMPISHNCDRELRPILYNIFFCN